MRAAHEQGEKRSSARFGIGEYMFAEKEETDTSRSGVKSMCQTADRTAGTAGTAAA